MTTGTDSQAAQEDSAVADSADSEAAASEAEELEAVGDNWKLGMWNVELGIFL